MAAITTLSEMRDYVKRELGAPINCVELANEQIDQAIENAIKIFTRYMYGEGVYEDYIPLTVSAGVSAYSLSAIADDRIEDVIDIDLSNGYAIYNNFFGDQSGSAFSNGYTNDLYGGYDGKSGEGMVIAGIDIALIYGKEWNRQFARYYRTDYRQGTSTLILVPTPNTNETGLLTVYVREKAVNLYNHILVEKLAVALALKMWGMVVNKYNMTMPGGGTINGDFIHQQGVAEEEKVIEQLLSESEPPDFFIA